MEPLFDGLAGGDVDAEAVTEGLTVGLTVAVTVVLTVEVEDMGGVRDWEMEIVALGDVVLLAELLVEALAVVETEVDEDQGKLLVGVSDTVVDAGEEGDGEDVGVVDGGPTQSGPTEPATPATPDVQGPEQVGLGSPGELPYTPAGHSVQPSAALKLKLPAGHMAAVGCDDPGGHQYPGLHGPEQEGVVLPACPNLHSPQPAQSSGHSGNSPAIQSSYTRGS